MAFITSPDLCEPCHSLVFSREFRSVVGRLQHTALESLRLSKAFREATTEPWEEIKHDDELYKWDVREPNFSTYGHLVSSQKHCALCKLILECQITKDGRSGAWIYSADSRPAFAESPPNDTQLSFAFDSSHARIISCSTLTVGTPSAKLADIRVTEPVSTNLWIVYAESWLNQNRFAEPAASQ
jgi:hypothetical protein